MDAAVAAGFAAAVAEPGLSSLGGGGFLLDAPVAGAPRLFDFFVDVPGRGRPPSAPPPVMTPITVRFTGADQVFSAGWGSVAVPGCLAGYLRVHQQRGRLPLEAVVAPARRLAREGVRLDRSQADVMLLLRDILTLTPEGRAIFTPGGELVGEGDRLRNPEFAGFLDLLAAGEVIDLSGVADELEAAMQQGRGAVTRADLESYVVHERTPLALEYRGASVLSNPAPSFGGDLALACLAGLAPEPVLLEDPDSYARYVRHVAGMVDRHAPGPRAVRGTTHVSVVDADGNVAAMTTSNGSCSGVFVPGTGIQLNNMMGEASLHPGGVDAGRAGVRVGSMMMPTVIRGADGTVAGVGSGGSERIPSTLVRVLTGIADLGLPLAEVVAAPRLHWDGSVLQVEPGLTPDVLARLATEWPVNRWARPDLYFGGAHAVARRPDGTVDAVGDARRGGAGLVVAV